MVTGPPALACAALACALLVVPGAPGAVRLSSGHLSPGHLSPGHPAGAVAGRARTPVTAVVVVGTLVGLLALGPAGALAGGGAAAVWRRRRRAAGSARARADVTVELADALGRIVEELRAGAHPATALAGVDADGPLARAVLGPAAAAAALGEGVPAALEASAGQHAGVGGDLQRIARAWALADRHGVPPADLLATVLTDLRWRTAHGHRVRAQLAGPRATAAVLTALPGLGLALGELVGAAPLAVLRSGVLGQALVVTGVGLAAAGAAWTGRIVRAAGPR